MLSNLEDKDGQALNQTLAELLSPWPKIIEGKKQARGLKIGIIVSRYNSFITENLLEGAFDGFSSHGGAEEI